jgi:superoxide dismutase, Cu-Zn family
MNRKALAVIIVLCAAACSQNPGKVTAKLEARSGTQASGSATFVEQDGKVNITLTARDLPPGKHGVYVHQNGDCAGSNAAAVGHRFNPGDNGHASVLGDIAAGADGNGTLTISSDAYTLGTGDRSLVGRSIVITADPDNPDLTETFGIISCGVIQQGEA